MYLPIVPDEVVSPLSGTHGLPYSATAPQRRPFNLVGTFVQRFANLTPAAIPLQAENSMSSAIVERR